LFVVADYDKIAKAYYEKRKGDRFDYNKDIEIPALIKLIGSVRGKILLDMGCGFGDHAQILSRKGAKKIIGFDVSKELVRFAQERKIPRTEFGIGDMDKKLPYKNSSFDMVYSGLAVHYVKNLKQLFKETRRVLRKGGMFCFSTQHILFNLQNQTPNGLVGVEKTPRRILGDYFDESGKLINLGKTMGKVRMYTYTMETFIKTALAAGFTLVDYVDAKPIKEDGTFRSRVPNKLPAFMLFKFKK